MSDKFKVIEDGSLLTFLTTRLNGWARNKIKQRLHSGCVVVNGESISKHDYELKADDAVEVLASPRNSQAKITKLEILYSDRDLVAINKPAGLLSVADGKSDKANALSILRNQLSSSKKQVKLWPVHRLDRDTSGVLLFATSMEMREAVNALWAEADKVYLAVVEGNPSPAQGTIDQPLRLDASDYQVHVGAHKDAKKAITHFETQRTVNNRSLLEIKLDTGRQHQIRAHMTWLGHPVIGDARYGTSGHRLGLHALRLTIKLPSTSKRLTFETPAPSDFYALIR